jgi:hypothetical protein
LKLGEVSKEVFGAIGYRDGGRFWDEGEDPRMAQIMQAVQQLQARARPIAGRAQGQDRQEPHHGAKAMAEIADRAKKLVAEIDLLQAQTLESLAKAGIPASNALRALGASPTLQ